MLLQVLKHSPAEVVQQVGVGLMLLTCAVEASIESPPLYSAGATTGALRTKAAGSRATTSSTAIVMSAEQEKLSIREQAKEILALTHPQSQREQPQRRRKGCHLHQQLKTDTCSNKKISTKRLQRARLELLCPSQADRVEDNLRMWAAKRGRNVKGLLQVLADTGHVRLEDACMIRGRASKVSGQRVKKVTIRCRASGRIEPYSLIDVFSCFWPRHPVASTTLKKYLGIS